VKVWDERTGTVGLESMCLLSYTLCTSDRLMSSYCIVRTSGGPRALLNLDVASDGHMLATGTEFAGDDACIHFFDLRSPAAPLWTHSQTYSEDITVVICPGWRTATAVSKLGRAGVHFEPARAG
jgi:hypothetical protein